MTQPPHQYLYFRADFWVYYPEGGFRDVNGISYNFQKLQGKPVCPRYFQEGETFEAGEVMTDLVRLDLYTFEVNYWDGEKWVKKEVME